MCPRAAYHSLEIFRRRGLRETLELLHPAAEVRERHGLLGDVRAHRCEDIVPYDRTRMHDVDQEGQGSGHQDQV